MEEHHCGFEPVDCDLKCGNKVQRNRLKAHQINTCSKRLLSCAYCAREFMADTLQSHHIKCLKVPVPCPYKCGVEELIRETVESHMQNDCSMVNSKNCIYQEAGCVFRAGNFLGIYSKFCQIFEKKIANFAKKKICIRNENFMICEAPVPIW